MKYNSIYQISQEQLDKIAVPDNFEDLIQLGLALEIVRKMSKKDLSTLFNFKMRKVKNPDTFDIGIKDDQLLIFESSLTIHP